MALGRGEKEAMTTYTAHWTEESPKKFAYRIASDFIEQLREKIKGKGAQKRLAKKLNVSPGRISQVLNNPKNLTLETMVEWARALGLKISVIAYDDDDKKNERGPINAEIFRLCWEHAKKPADMWEFQENTKSVPKETVFFIAEIGGHHGGARVTTNLPGRTPNRQGYQHAQLASVSFNPKGASLANVLNKGEKW